MFHSPRFCYNPLTTRYAATELILRTWVSSPVMKNFVRASVMLGPIEGVSSFRSVPMLAAVLWGLKLYFSVPGAEATGHRQKPTNWVANACLAWRPKSSRSKSESISIAKREKDLGSKGPSLDRAACVARCVQRLGPSRK